MNPRQREYERLKRLDRRHSWKPFTPMSVYTREDPIILARGKGPYVYDLLGKRYLDGVSSLWVNVHGHREPAIDAAIRAQLGRVAHTTLLGPTHPGAIELAAALARIAPGGLRRVFFSDNGSTAVEVALKMAFQYWRQRRRDPRPEKTRFVAFANAYHGDTLGSVSVGGMDLFHRIFHPLLFKVRRVSAAYCYRCPLAKTYPSCRIACLAELEQILDKEADRIAAVVIEPKVHGAAGMIVQPPGYLARVRDLCARHDVLLVADEVATGFGRTGALFACDLEDVRPDFLCVAKSITGGTLPLAATLTTEKIYEAFLGEPHENRTFFHGHTYTGNPLACAAALANLGLYRKRRLLSKVRRSAAILKRALASVSAHPHVGEIRQAGLMVGVELVRDKRTREPFPPRRRAGARVCLAAAAQGLLIRPLGDVVVLMPPLAVSHDQIRRMAKALAGSLESAFPTAGRHPRRGFPQVFHTSTRTAPQSRRFDRAACRPPCDERRRG